MITRTLTYGCFSDDGFYADNFSWDLTECGFISPSLFPGNTDGRVVAHDLIDHAAAHGSGDLTDEIMAIGAAWAFGPYASPKDAKNELESLFHQQAEAYEDSPCPAGILLNSLSVPGVRHTAIREEAEVIRDNTEALVAAGGVDAAVDALVDDACGECEACEEIRADGDGSAEADYAREAIHGLLLAGIIRSLEVFGSASAISEARREIGDVVVDAIRDAAEYFGEPADLDVVTVEIDGQGGCKATYSRDGQTIDDAMAQWAEEDEDE